MRRIQAQITGKVQGVGYRAWVQKQASMLGLAGWVANRNDGSVTLEAQGDAGAIEELLHSLKKGPARAVVQKVLEKALPVKPGTVEGFEIR